MPALPITDKTSAWGYWKSGLIAAANVSAGINSPAGASTLNNLAVRRGFNAIRIQLGWPGAYGLTAADIATIASQGWTSTALTQASQAAGAALSIQSVAQQIDQILDTARKLGVGVILAVTDANQGLGGTLWQQAALQDALVAFWGATARRWPAAHCPQLIGYDLLNEPCPDPTKPFTELNALAPNPATLNNWRGLANRCVAAIRAHDSQTPILVQGIYGGAARGLDIFRNLDNPGDRSLLIQDPAARVVYAFRTPGPAAFTHQGLSAAHYAAIGTLYGDAAYAHCRQWDHYGAPGASGNTWVNLSQDFTSYVHLVGQYRNDAFHFNAGRKTNPQPDFHKQFGVPLFVCELATLNPRLPKASKVDARAPVRTITALSLDSGKVTLTMGNLDAQGWQVPCGPQSTSEPFSNAVQVSISGTGTPLDGQTCQAILTAGQKTIQFPVPSTLAALAPITLGPKASDAGWQPVGTITLGLPPAKQNTLEAARLQYVRDALKMCRELGFSWGWHFEDNEQPNEFVGWRASPAIAVALGSAAAGHTWS